MTTVDVNFYFQDTRLKIVWTNGEWVSNDGHSFSSPKLAAVRECEIYMLKRARDSTRYTADIQLVAEAAAMTARMVRG